MHRYSMSELPNHFFDFCLSHPLPGDADTLLEMGTEPNDVHSDDLNHLLRQLIQSSRLHQ